MLDVFDSLVAERPAETTGEGPVELTELLRVLVGSAGHAMATAALIDVTDMHAHDLQQIAIGIEQLRRALDATQAHTLAELTDRDTCDRTDGSSTSRWLAREAQLPAGVARQRVTVASALRHQLPEQVDRALTDGHIGIDHARVIAEATNPRNTAALADEIDHHLSSAGRCTGFHAWRRTFQARAALLDDDGTYDPATDLARNRLRLSPTTHFMELRGELVGDHALIVRDTIDTIADELFLAYTRDHTLNPDIEIPNRATLRALALEEACRRALARDPGDTRPARTQVHLVLHGRPLADGGIAIDPIAHDRERCPWLLRDTAVLLCDASVAATVLDHLGLPTDSGRNSRVPGPRLRRALDARDGGCTHPGCDRPPRHCDAHHILAWEQAAEPCCATSCCSADATTASHTDGDGTSPSTPRAGPTGPHPPATPSPANDTNERHTTTEQGPPHQRERAGGTCSGTQSERTSRLDRARRATRLVRSRRTKRPMQADPMTVVIAPVGVGQPRERSSEM